LEKHYKDISRVAAQKFADQLRVQLECISRKTPCPPFDTDPHYEDEFAPEILPAIYVPGISRLTKIHILMAATLILLGI
jgi:hypothetical protein